jgi:hypothetical protein
MISSGARTNTGAGQGRGGNVQPIALCALLLVRVHDLAPPPVSSKRYGLINDHVKEQLERFGQRLDDKSRYWKNQRD